MLAITLLLLVIGALLASAGTLGFVAAWQSRTPDYEDLRLAALAATIGRGLAIPGLCLYGGHYGASGAGLYALMLVVAVTMASYLTKANPQGNPART